MDQEPQITWHDHKVGRDARQRLLGQRGCVVWFTGLSGCGKSTVANLVDEALLQLGRASYLLDGDNIRHGLNAPPAMLADRGEGYAQRFGLGFSPEDRAENIRRTGAVAQLFASAGLITLAAFVSPYRRDRDEVRHLVERFGEPGDFVEVFVDAPLEVCEQRDPKGLYKQARAGQLSGMTGIDAPYEPPLSPQLKLDATQPPEVLAAAVITHLRAAGRLSVHGTA